MIIILSLHPTLYSNSEQGDQKQIKIMNPFRILKALFYALSVNNKSRPYSFWRFCKMKLLLYRFQNLKWSQMKDSMWILKFTFNKIGRLVGIFFYQKLRKIGRIGLEINFFFGVTLNFATIDNQILNRPIGSKLADFSQFLVNIFCTMTPTSYQTY